MTWVVFLRGANVGGHRKFQPKKFAEGMGELGVTSIGAAGTFLVRTELSAESVHDAFKRRLSFETETMICPADEIVGLVRSNPFGVGPLREGVRGFVSVLASPPRVLPKVPMEQPRGNDWEVRVLRITNRYVFSLRRRRGERTIYPNEVVESKLGVKATTRGWETILSVHKILNTSS